jgi:ribosomal protein S18 acetylase RimI-like enzyme
MIIRPAQVDDLPAIQAIVEEAYAVYIARIGRRPTPMDADYEVSVRSGRVFVAGNDRVVGLIVLIPAADHLLIENVAVSPRHQHEGLGRALLAFAEKEARQRNLKVVKLYTNVAMTENIDFYVRLGYREDGRLTEAGFKRVFLSKVVDPKQ